MVLFDIANRNDWMVTDDLRHVLETLGAPTSEINSSIQVSANFLVEVWNEGMPGDRARALTFAVLNALVSNHWNSADQIIRDLWEKSAGRTQYRSNLNQAILDWIRGHFLDLSI